MTAQAAIAELEELADRIANPAAGLARAAEILADETREGIRRAKLVDSGELLDSVFAQGPRFGASASHAVFVNARRRFVPVVDGEVEASVEPQVRAALGGYIRGGR